MLSFTWPHDLRRTLARVSKRFGAPSKGETHRISSFPFVSGDTFRLLADIVLDRSTEPESVSPVSRDDALVFVEADFWLKGPGIPWIVDWLKRSESEVLPQLILHNGDATPSAAELLRLRGASRRVWAVNVGDDICGVGPLPIGIENVHHGRNGLVQGFLGDLRSKRPRSQRSLEILASFDVSTNRAVRAPLARAASHSRYGWFEPTLPPNAFREVVRASRFVLSPPGNGNDCHRTWEALYLGAIPIIQKGTLARSISSRLPILVLDDLREALEMSPKDLEEVEGDLTKRSLEVAMMPHWIIQLFS